MAEDVENFLIDKKLGPKTTLIGHSMSDLPPLKSRIPGNYFFSILKIADPPLFSLGAQKQRWPSPSAALTSSATSLPSTTLLSLLSYTLPSALTCARCVGSKTRTSLVNPRPTPSYNSTSPTSRSDNSYSQT